MSVFSKEYCEKMRVRIDCGNMLAEAVGKHGITAEEISEMMPRAEGAFAGVEKKRGEMRWRLLPSLKSFPPLKRQRNSSGQKRIIS